jgi:hypothetical protein
MKQNVLCLTVVAIALAACSDVATAPNDSSRTMISALTTTGTGCSTIVTDVGTSLANPNFKVSLTWPLCSAGDAPAYATPTGNTGPYIWAWEGYACGNKHTTSSDGSNFVIRNPLKVNATIVCPNTYYFLLTIKDRNGATISLGPERGTFMIPYPLPSPNPPPPGGTPPLQPGQ